MFIVRRMAWIVLFVSLAVTAAAWRSAISHNHDHQLDELTWHTNAMARTLQDRFDRYLVAVQAARAMAASSDHVTEDDWCRYTTQAHLFDAYPGLAAMSYITPAAGDHGERYLRQYVEPAGTQGWSAGMDVATIAEARHTLDASRASGEPMLSPMLRLDEANATRYLMFVAPVHRGEEATFTGWISARIDFDQLLASIPDEVNHHLAYQIIDAATGPRSPAHSILHDTADAGLPQWQQVKSITVGGRELQLRIRPTTRFLSSHSQKLKPAEVLMGGIALSLLLFAAVWALGRSGRKAHALAAAMTESLRRSEAEARKLALVAQCTDNSVVITDAHGRIEWVNDGFTRMVGYTLEEAVGRMPAELLHGDAAAEPVSREMTDARVTGRGFHLEVPNYTKDGHKIWISVHGHPIFDDDGRLLCCMTIAADITERKLAETKLMEAHRKVQFTSAWFRGIIEGATDYICATDMDMRVVTLNSAYQREFEKVFGVRIEVGDHLPTKMANVPMDLEKTQLLAARVRQGDAFIYENDFGDPDNYRRTFQVSLSPIRDDAGNLVGNSRIVRDVTESRRQQESLRRSEEQYRCLAAASTAVIWHADAKRAFQPQLEWTHFTGQSCGAEARHRWLSMVHRDDRRRLTRDWDAARAQAMPFETKVQVWHALHRAFRVCLFRGVPMLQAGEIREWIGTVTDISDRLRAEQAEQERNSLRAAVKSQEHVLAVVGHELRTPLAATRAMSELLLTDPVGGDEHIKFLQAINNETVRMANMVNDLLEVARLNNGTMRWNWGAVDVETQCREAVESARPLLTQGVELTMTCAIEGLAVRGDSEAIRRLVLNLITNASRFTQQGSIALSVARRAIDREAWLVIEVADTGDGIKAEQAEKLGEAFALSSGVVGPDYSRGSGLGLAICRGIAGAHGGYLTMRSRPGAGTIVTATLRADLTGPVDDEGRMDVIVAASEAGSAV